MPSTGTALSYRNSPIRCNNSSISAGYISPTGKATTAAKAAVSAAETTPPAAGTALSATGTASSAAGTVLSAAETAQFAAGTVLSAAETAKFAAGTTPSAPSSAGKASSAMRIEDTYSEQRYQKRRVKTFRKISLRIDKREGNKIKFQVVI